MPSIETTFMGLELSSPLVASSSPLTSNVNSIVSIAKAGAGAVVLKSIFEEQILGHAASMNRYSDYPGADDYLYRYMEGDYINSYINLIKAAKASADIPIIASINCYDTGSWIEYAGVMEKAGADAIELNIFLQPTSPDSEAVDIEIDFLNIADAVTASVNRIPVAVKLSPHFTNTLNVIHNLQIRGIKGVVLFNRTFEPEIDIRSMELTASDPLSYPAELRASLRTVALCSGMIKDMDIAVSTGVHDSEAIIRSLLSGADATQICTTLYRNGIEYIERMNTDLKNWMKEYGFRSIEEFRGKMNSVAAKDEHMYYRTQYMQYFPK